MLCVLLALLACVSANARDAPTRYGFLPESFPVTHNVSESFSPFATPRHSLWPGTDSQFFMFQLFVSDFNETRPADAAGTQHHDLTVESASIAATDAPWPTLYLSIPRPDSRRRCSGACTRCLCKPPCLTGSEGEA